MAEGIAQECAPPSFKPEPSKPALDVSELKAEERRRIQGITEAGKALGISVELVDSCISDDLSIEQSKVKFADALAQMRPKVASQPNGTTVASADKFRKVAQDALTLKMFSGNLSYTCPSEATKHLPDEHPRKTYESRSWGDGAIASESQQIAGRSLRDIACLCLKQVGVKDPWSLPSDVAARMALSTPFENAEAWRHATELGLWAADGATHTPASFPNLLRDAMNKRARMGYDMAPTTYQVWARQAPSVADFKTIYRPILGEAGDLDQLEDDGRFPDDVLTDAQRTYVVEQYGKRWSVSFKTIVNDDMNSLAVVPQRYGAAARMTLNRRVYERLTSNPSIDTGSGAGNLFNSTALTTAGGHNNDAGAGAPSVAALNTAYTAMATQVGLRGAANLETINILNISPRFIIGPAALRGTILQLLTSTANPAVGGDATGSSGVNNIWQGALEPVIDATLDANSAAAWYLSADPGLIDTVEYTFLNGFESPRIEREFDFETKGSKMTMHWVFGAEVIDHRGLYRGGV